MNLSDKILVIGSSGQIGTELVMKLRDVYGSSNVIASDLKPGSKELMESGPFETLDVLDPNGIDSVIRKHQIKHVYLLAALLSATAEKDPKLGWKLNMDGLFNVLDLAREKRIAKVFWPSSIAVFGPTTPRENTPQYTIMEPSTVYGISKLAGERWCEYYFKKYNVDVRSIRYPGLIGWKSAPGGGTTDYAVTIYHDAVKKGSFDCFLKEDTRLPMMYMDDALKATLDIMQAEDDRVKIRSSYNVAGMSFTPGSIAASISKRVPGFSITYNPDFRQKIADSWPASINDDDARKDWNWKPDFDLESMTETMINSLKKHTYQHL